MKYDKKHGKNTKGFYLALGVCLLAVGVAAWTTYDSVVNFTAQDEELSSQAVSYTHLDVYKRQPPGRPVKAATPCGAPRFGGWGGMRTGAASSGKTGLEPAQDALKALRVHLFVREEKSPAQAVLRRNASLGQRCAAAQHHNRDGLEVKPGFHDGREEHFHIAAALLPDHAAGFLVHAAGLSSQHLLHLGVGNRQSHIPADLFFHFIHAADHAKFQTAAGGGIGDAVIQTLSLIHI